ARFFAVRVAASCVRWAGLMDRHALEPSFERHSELTERERAQGLGAAVDGDRRVRELWRFACEGYMGRLTREHAEKLAALEAELEVTVDGETVPFRMVRPAIANEPDRSKRERLDGAMWETTAEQPNPMYEHSGETLHAALPG